MQLHTVFGLMLCWSIKDKTRNFIIWVSHCNIWVFFQDAGSRAVKSHDKQTQYKQRFAVWVSTKWMHIKEITDVSFKLDS